MSTPGQYVVGPNGLSTFQVNVPGQLITGPPGTVGDAAAPAVTNLNVPGGQVQEVAIAPLTASSLIRGMGVGQPLIAWLQGAPGAAEVVGYARMTGAGTAVLATANLGALAATFGPAAPELFGVTGLVRHALENSGSQVSGGNALTAMPSPGVVANRTAAESSIFAIANVNTVVIANPRAALPAGFMCTGIRPSGFAFAIGLGNLTAAPADPGITNWDVGQYTFDNSQGDIAGGSGTAAIPGGQNGPVCWNVLPGLVASFGVIPGATVAEAVISGLGEAVSLGDNLIVCPRLAMPEAIMCPSHSRVTANGSLAWGIANLDPAVATAAHDIVCDVAVLKALPLF